MPRVQRWQSVAPVPPVDNGVIDAIGGVWRTIRGTPVLIEDGQITKGPAALKGKDAGAVGKPKSFNEEANAAMKRPAKVGPRGFPLVTVGDKTYMVKKGRNYSRSEVLGSRHAQAADVDVVSVRPTRVGGTWGHDVSMVEYHPDLQTLDKLSNPEKERAIAGVAKASIERQTLYDYVIGYSDPNDGNYFIRSNRIVGLDKDPAFSDSTSIGASTRMARPHYLRYAGGGAFTFSKPEISHMVKAAERMADDLTSEGNRRDAVGVRARAAVLRRLLQHSDNPTVEILERMGDGERL